MAIIINTNTVSTNWKSLAITLPPPTKKRKLSLNDDKERQEQAIQEKRPPRITKAVCLDCEMVGIGEYGINNMVARVSLVNQLGECLYDKYVKPTEPVVDYRTNVSGITQKHLDEQGIDFETVQAEVAKIIENKILVGHAIHNDLQVLFLSHPKRKIRDTQRYKEFRLLFNGGLPSLKALAERVLGLKIQTGEHDSVEDSRATMHLYVQHRRQWEKYLREIKSPTLTSKEKHERIKARKDRQRLKYKDKV